MKYRHEVVAVLDRSGSMSRQVNDVIGGFNTYITNIAKDSAAEGVETNVTLVLFDDQYEVVYASRPIDSIEPLTTQIFYTRGGTALLYAVGRAIEECETAVLGNNRSALDLALIDGPEEVTVTFAIFTDGEENSSHNFPQEKFSREKVAGNIARLTDDGWTFLYLGADQSKWQAENISATLNIAAGNTRAYAKSAADFGKTFDVLSAGTTKRLQDTKLGIKTTRGFFAEGEDALTKETK